jgi:6-phosphogluconate dehydrogenase
VQALILNEAIAKVWELIASVLAARFICDARKCRAGRVLILEILLLGSGIRHLCRTNASDLKRKEGHMELGMIGLGRMGTNMVRRLLRAGHQCVVYDLHAEAVQALVKEGANGANSLEDFVSKLKAPRTVWMMVPAAVVDPTLKTLIPFLEANDVIIDGGNSYYHDDIRRATELKPKGIHYVDAGTSGGVWGSERGYCLMIGGDDAVVQRIDPIFSALAPNIDSAPRTPGREKAGGTAEHGYLHCGPSGAGHFVKMVHNGIEYGMMAAYAEGLNILRHANVGKQQRTEDVINHLKA